MGTHAYIFSQSNVIPTLRELFDLAAQKGHTLKLSVERFDDDEEEQEFLDKFMDSSDWREVSFDNQANEWVLNIFSMRRDDPYFKMYTDDFSKPLDKMAESPGKTLVVAHLDAAQVYYDIQIGLSGESVWPPQEAIINYFQARETDMLYLDNLNVYTQRGKTILSR